MQDEVWVVAKVGMERVVLEMRRVQVIASELIASVFSDNAFEVVHGEEVGVVPAGGLEGHGEGSVEHLIVALVEQGRSEVGLFRVGSSCQPGGGEGAEVVADFVGQRLAADCTGT